MPELHCRRPRDTLRLAALFLLDGRLRSQHLQHPSGGGIGLGEGAHQVSHHQQRQQNLVNIIDKRDDFAGGHAPGLHPQPAEPHDGQNGQVHDQLGAGIEQRRQLSDPDGGGGVFLRRAVEPLLLLVRTGKRADHPHARQIFPQHPGQLIQPALYRAVQRHRLTHHQGDNQHEQRDSHDNHQ